ncbi:MAG: tRNA (pseudouridine(54)-N(1))-methyltransferase TrmY [Candidatus Nanoarchaeia archaeon]|nr:tRNA (pseudouridine(54)-N(1))-methyltransferase TrmY [Candidatus Nanoarchaeia archaeon]
MREFIYFSSKAKTTGNFGDDLMKAGRMDIACQIVIMAFFLSHQLRRNVKLHLIFNGPPDAPKHIEMFPGNKLDEDSESDISKKDVAGLIKKILYKYRPGIKNEVMSGYFIEKKSFSNVVNEMLDEGKEIFLLDKKGEDIREVKIGKNPVFILGDHDGIPKDEMKKLKRMDIKKVSIGNEMYFASQTMTIVQNELDRRGIE